MNTESAFTYHAGSRGFQEQFDSVRLADRLAEKSVQRELDEYDKKFIESQRFFFLATADDNGEPSCNFRGGAPGFVRVESPSSLIWPEYNGNGMFLTLGNLAVNPRVHLLFLDFERQERFRVAGTAEVLSEDPALADFHEAQLLVRVHVEHAFPNCRRYVPKMELVETSRHVPQIGVQTPCAYWKRTDKVFDVLPAADPANDPTIPI